MELRRIADAVGIGKYPAELEEVYASLPQDNDPACNIDLIDSLQREYEIFGPYYDVVRKTAQEINKDENRSTWIKVAVAFATGKSVTEARRVPVPKADGTQVTALLPLYILIPQIPLGIAEYRRRGFSEEEIAQLNQSYAAGIRIVEGQVGMPCINALYYHWLNLFIKARIFHTEGLQFELCQLPPEAVYLRSRESGLVVPVMAKGTYHRTGIQPVGSAGYEDADGAFTAQFREDGENYYGHGAYNGVVDPEEKAYPKACWEYVVGPGDDCLNLHIPQKADISPEALDRAIASGYRIAEERYPERNSAALLGYSWILDPRLAEILGPNSNITGLVNRFAKYPFISDGQFLFGYVFPKKKYASYQELPDTTSLQKKLKQLYVSGGHIHAYYGAIIK